MNQKEKDTIQLAITYIEDGAYNTAKDKLQDLIATEYNEFQDHEEDLPGCCDENE